MLTIVPYHPQPDFINNVSLLHKQKIAQLTKHKGPSTTHIIQSKKVLRRVSGAGVLFIHYRKGVPYVVAIQEKDETYSLPFGKHADYASDDIENLKTNQRCHKNDTYFKPFKIKSQMDTMQTEAYEELTHYLDIAPPTKAIIESSPLISIGNPVYDNTGYASVVELRGKLNIKAINEKIQKYSCEIQKNQENKELKSGCNEIIGITLISLPLLLKLQKNTKKTQKKHQKDTKKTQPVNKQKTKNRIKDITGKTVVLRDLLLIVINSARKFNVELKDWNAYKFKNWYQS